LSSWATGCFSRTQLHVVTIDSGTYTGNGNRKNSVDVPKLYNILRILHDMRLAHINVSLGSIKTRNFLTSGMTVNFSKGTLVHGVSHEVITIFIEIIFHRSGK
jgi:hypothetical protein